MTTTEISNEPAFPIIGTNPIFTSLALKPPGPSTARLRALIEWCPRLGLLLLALALPMAAQGTPTTPVHHDTQVAGQNLQSAYLLRARTVQPWGNDPQPSLQAHFADVLRILEHDVERSLRTALDRLEASQGTAWTAEERETWRQRLASERKRNTDVLREYQARGLFPVNEVDPLRPIPIFVDRQDTACAVGYLMRRSGAGKDVEAIVRANNLVYVTDVEEGPLVDWILMSGLTQEEAALIQPGYPPPLAWHIIDPPLEGERQIGSLLFSSFSSEFVADPEHQEDGHGTSTYAVAMAPDSAGNDVPWGHSDYDSGVGKGVFIRPYLWTQSY